MLLEGYTYYRQQTYSGNKSRWLCSTDHKKGCKALIHTVDDKITFRKLEHCHPPKRNWYARNPCSQGPCGKKKYGADKTF